MHAWRVGILVAYATLATACPPDGAGACNVDDDCARDEECIAGTCAPRDEGGDEGEGADEGEGEGDCDLPDVYRDADGDDFGDADAPVSGCDASANTSPTDND